MVNFVGARFGSGVRVGFQSLLLAKAIAFMRTHAGRAVVSIVPCRKKRPNHILQHGDVESDDKTGTDVIQFLPAKFQPRLFDHKSSNLQETEGCGSSGLEKTRP